jgi:hypothetical protein
MSRFLALAVMFMIIGSAIYNTMIAPKYFPQTNGISGEKILMAGLVGAVCAVLGGFLGSIVSDRD